MDKTFTFKVDKIAHDGAAEGTHQGSVVRVHGMLPGESGIIDTHRKKGISIGELKELITASPSRKNPDELHFLACSPWQVMEYPLQVSLKHDMLKDLFHYYEDAPPVAFTSARQFYGYRTKVEFSFCDRSGDAEIPLSLAFHVRGGGNRRIPLDKGCALASAAMNRVALEICARLRESGYAATDLKTLIVRESKSEGKILAMLFAKKKEVMEFSIADIPELSGFKVFYSTEKSPASVPTKLLWERGSDVLSERIGGCNVAYSWDSFFQNNIPVFEDAMEAINRAIPKNSSVVELYAGVGTIGLLLAKNARDVRGVEIVANAVEAANNNARSNGIVNYSATCLAAEEIDGALIGGVDVLVLDPPRAGLHPKLIKQIIDKQPPTIVYLSCNPETQARDYSTLSALYKIDTITGFDFYPQTPHCESLITLSLRPK